MCPPLLESYRDYIEEYRKWTNQYGPASEWEKNTSILDPYRQNITRQNITANKFNQYGPASEWTGNTAGILDPYRQNIIANKFNQSVPVTENKKENKLCLCSSQLWKK